jgi:hypothetical protein
MYIYIKILDYLRTQTLNPLTSKRSKVDDVRLLQICVHVFLIVTRNKSSLRKYMRIEITPCMLSDHNALKLELNNKTTENMQIIGD